MTNMKGPIEESTVHTCTPKLDRRLVVALVPHCVLSLLFLVSALGCLNEQEHRLVQPALPSVQKEASASALHAGSVILVTIDTLRADALGFMHGAAQTPVIDGLSKTGLVFDNAIAAAMLTTPSHASIMTSLFPIDHGVYDNESGVADEVTTLAERFSDAGFQTLAVINFPHLNPEVSNLGQGFQHILRAKKHGRNAQETTREAIAALEHIEPGKFFMWVHYTDPHAPYEPPATHAPRPIQTSSPTPIAEVLKAAPGFQRHNRWFKQAFKTHRYAEELKQKYIAEVENTDAALGEFVTGLKEMGVEDAALVITADHGENLGERQLYFHHGGLYRETVHVPLIFASLNNKNWHKRVHTMVSHVDIAPTILEMAGLGVSPEMRGRSLLPFGRGETLPKRYVFSEHLRAQLVSVRSDEGTLILHRTTNRQFPTYPFHKGKREMYDTLLDPHERQPLTPQGDLANDLEHALQRYLKLNMQLTARAPVDQDRESLRALGYIE